MRVLTSPPAHRSRLGQPVSPPPTRLVFAGCGRRGEPRVRAGWRRTRWLRSRRTGRRACRSPESTGGPARSCGPRRSLVERAGAAGRPTQPRASVVFSREGRGPRTSTSKAGGLEGRKGGAVSEPWTGRAGGCRDGRLTRPEVLAMQAAGGGRRRAAGRGRAPARGVAAAPREGWATGDGSDGPRTPFVDRN